MPVQTVVSVAQQSRAADVYAFTAPQPIPSGLKAVTLIPNIALADKLAVGKTLSCQICVNDQCISGGSWQSYGPGGHTSGDGTVNPDPEFGTGDITKYVGQILSAKITLDQTTTAGLTVTLTT